MGGVRRIPLSLKFATMPLWGNIFYALVPAARRAARQNLRRVMPGASTLELHRASSRLFTNYAQSIANLFALYSDLPIGIDTVTYGGELLEQLQREKRGAVLATGHMGYWQIAPFLMAKKAYAPLTMAMAEEPNQQTGEFEQRFRAQLRIVYTTRSPLALVELARLVGRGELVGMQMDRSMGLAHILVDFFGTPAPFPTAPATLARATRVPLIPAFILATCDRRHCAFYVEEPIEVAHTRNRGADIADATRKLVAIYERFVARHPDQWFHFFDFWSPPTMPPAVGPRR